MEGSTVEHNSFSYHIIRIREKMSRVLVDLDYQSPNTYIHFKVYSRGSWDNYIISTLDTCTYNN